MEGSANVIGRETAQKAEAATRPEVLSQKAERVGKLLTVIRGQKENGTIDAETRETSIFGQAEQKGLFEENGVLTYLSKRSEDNRLSILEQADAYDGGSDDKKAQSANLRALVEVTEAISTATDGDGKPIDSDAAEIVRLIDENLRIDRNGQLLTRSEWYNQLQKVATPEERAQLEAQGVWKFVEIVPAEQESSNATAELLNPLEDPDNPAAEASNVANGIMRREIQHLEQMIAEKQANKENTDAQRDQLLTLKIALKADGSLGDLLRTHVLQQALDHADETGVAINPEDVRKFYDKGHILQDPKTNKPDIIAALRRYNGPHGIDDKIINIFKKYDGDVTQILEDAKITLYGEKEKKFRELFFGNQQPEDFKELQDLIDPHRTDLAKHLTKRGSLWILILAAALGKGFVEDINPVDAFSRPAA